MSETNLLLDMPTKDEPVVEVRAGVESVTIRFDWPVNQRWYLTPDEARRISVALLMAANRVEAHDV